MSYDITAVIKSNIMAAPGHYRITLHAPEIAGQAEPGQFVHVKAAESLIPLLRRPFSINDVDELKGDITLFYKVVGSGTELLSSRKAGETVKLMGPLGRGFPLNKGKNIIMVGGGIGTAPLLFLAKKARQLSYRVLAIIGTPTSELVFMAQDFKKLGCRIEITTEDGSLGLKGFPTDVLKQILDSGYSSDTVYSCGPIPMMKAVAQITKSYKIPAYLSMEERMGCGIGACLACVCKTTTDNGITYKRVCADGPVFSAEEVVFDE